MAESIDVMIAGTVGGREHALALAIANEVGRLTFTHGGNAGTQDMGLTTPFTDSRDIAGFADSSGQDLVIIGPEAPLLDGLADRLRSRGIITFGAGAEGAQLEASKAFSAEFNSEFGIRQPEYAIANDTADALAYITSHDVEDYVIKADGLAGGKGVIVPETYQESLTAVRGMMSGDLFKDAGKRIIFQRRIKGPELSPMYILDGEGGFTLLPLSQDHKRLRDNDKGPNTGGMGAYTPIPFENPELIDELMLTGEKIAQGLLARGISAPGTAYVGAMLDPEAGNKPSVIEINVRPGDPETQVVTAALGQAGISTYELLSSAAHGQLESSVRGAYLGGRIGGTALTVCLAAEGYGVIKSPATGTVIHGLDRQYENVVIHHGGTKLDETTQRIVTNGGRIMYVTASGATIDEAARHAYSAIGRDNDGVWFEGMEHRSDIAWQTRVA